MNILSTFHSSSKKDKEVDELKTKTGRSYDCVFCQRGFTTAQALGGHMNIHRKDRASNKTIKAAATKTTLVVANGEEDDDDDDDDDDEGHVATYFRDASHQYYNSSSTNPSSTKPNYSAQFGDDWGGNLSLHTFTLPASDAASGFRQQEVEELDLELRLGHSTW